MVDEFNADVLEPLGADLEAGTRVVFAPDAVGGNDLFARYLAPTLHVWTYNVGGDKPWSWCSRSGPRT